MLHDWISMTNAEDAIFWLNGPAGAGKTAIAKSLAESLEGTALAASFFFWRTDPGRSDERSLIPTLAYQLIQAIPTLKPFVEKQIKDDPALFEKTLSQQLRLLIINPIVSLKQACPRLDLATLPRLIIIDGLDECGGMRNDRIQCQERAIYVLQELASYQDVFPFRVLICSRPEEHISFFFSQPFLHRITYQLTLDDSLKPQDDVRLYVTDSFVWIATNHPDKDSLPPHWPGAHAIFVVVSRSSGQFVYPATVMKFLRSLSHRPGHRLNDILNDRDSGGDDSPTAHLDRLYRQILSCCTVAPHLICRIIAFHLVHQELPFNYGSDPYRAYRTHGDRYSNGGDPTFPVEERPPLSVIEQALTLDRGTIKYSLSALKSLVEVHSPRGGFLKIHQTTFTDFLCNHSRSGEWYINLESYAEEFIELDIREFESAELWKHKAFWYTSFNRAILRVSSTNAHVKALLRNDKWTNMSSYQVGLRFLYESGLNAGPVVYPLLAWSYRHMGLEAELKDSFATILLSLIQPYLKDSILFTLFLIHTNDLMATLRGTNPAIPFLASRLARSSNRQVLSQSDENALQLLSSGERSQFMMPFRSLIAQVFSPELGGLSLVANLTNNLDGLVMDSVCHLIDVYDEKQWKCLSTPELIGTLIGYIPLTSEEYAQNMERLLQSSAARDSCQLGIIFGAERASRRSAGLLAADLRRLGKTGWFGTVEVPFFGYTDNLWYRRWCYNVIS
ncbi:hypothetical protein BJ165DRAFT_264388 [Panaeolus papilionaceus]|nr:hypothetical protein BJ165DRAFT_264388 [Panaeolus papilionaceus]